MPKVPTGEVRWTDEGPVARVTMQGRDRESFLMPTCKTPDEATTRSKLLAGLATRFRKAGVIGQPEARTLLETAATCTGALLPGVVTVAGELCGGTLPETLAKVPTFEEVADMWTSGDLAKKWPDHVKAKKDADIDIGRLKRLCDITFGGVRVGALPMSRFTLGHAEEMMRNLPEAVEQPATRRHYAMTIGRICNLAVYPLKCIAGSPLPKGFLPKAGKPPRYPYLWPAEDAQLLAHKPTPLAYRVLFAFLAREGCREGEALAFQVRDFNLEVGNVRLDENKTDDPRSWALDPSVKVALRRWVAFKNLQPNDHMFVDDNGGPLTLGHRLAERLRTELLKAGVTRHELHHEGKNTGKLRMHDLRGTFVTISLANNKTETWVCDRTGHQSSGMVNRYRKQAREADELNLGELAPMDQAIPELRSDCPAITPENDGAAVNTNVSEGYGVRDDSAELVDPAENKPFGETEREQLEGSAGQSGVISAAEPDHVESALATALVGATSAGEWTVVARLAGELEARRRARSQTVDLASERAKRGKR